MHFFRQKNSMKKYNAEKRPMRIGGLLFVPVDVAPFSLGSYCLLAICRRPLFLSANAAVL